MTKAFLALPAHLRTRLAQALESGMLEMPCSSWSGTVRWR